jgi:Family of unknown function (DUF6152)
MRVALPPGGPAPRMLDGHVDFTGRYYPNRGGRMLESAKFAWANPHRLISFDVKDDKGNVAHWVGELGSPSALTLVGFTKASVQPGDVITVHTDQSKVNKRCRSYQSHCVCGWNLIA